MCGLAGQLSESNNSDVIQAVLCRMADAIAHRGPDSDGFWFDGPAGVGLAHRRLAIVELSAAGAQPMLSTDSRYVLAFNGEIYNHMTLRGALESAALAPSLWRGHSDTETLLAGFSAWGIEETLRRSTGMFALALWDREERRLTLARDRLGEKPLYYGWQGQGPGAVFLFGSELAALRRHPSFNAEIDRNALALFMRHNCVGGSRSIYSGTFKLGPGQLLSVSMAAPEPKVKSWWAGAEVPIYGAQHRFTGTPEEAADALELLLLDAIGEQMVADVPLGAFLSGGIDSSTVVALMRACSDRPVKTFSIGFNEAGYDEAVHAKAVARHLGTEHTEIYLTPAQAQDVIPELPRLYSEPFADSSQIPTFLVSRLARQHVTVSLSGDAGDELFCGYNRYRVASGLWRRLSHVPRPLRRLAANAITAVPPAVWDRGGAMLGSRRLGDKLHKGAALLDSSSVADLYLGLVSHWHKPLSVVQGAYYDIAACNAMGQDFSGLSDVERMMALDMLGYLPDDILVKIDRAAMGVSLETRVPFLNHRVVEFAWSLPLAYKLRDGVTKWPVRQVLYRHVPRELVERPKMGFSVPIDSWLRGPLRDWAESLLSESRLRQEGYFAPGPIRRVWDEHLSGRRNWQYQLWDVLMFQAWLEYNKGL